MQHPSKIYNTLVTQKLLLGGERGHMMMWYLCKDHMHKNTLFAKRFLVVIIFIKTSILDVPLASKYAAEFAHLYQTFSKYLNKI